MLQSHRKSIFETLGRHPIHPFPARMAPGIALDVLAGRGTKLRVLDPMAGSGTVLAVARQHGHYAIGVDIDPLAVLIAKVWTRDIDAAAVNRLSERVLASATQRFGSMKSRDAYPVGADDETKGFTRYWFDDYARRQLTSLADAITETKDISSRDVLWCAFSRLIITKSAGASLAMDLSHSRPHRTYRYAPVKPFNGFLKAVATVVENCPPQALEDQLPEAKTQRGDARRLDIPDQSIDLTLTSPPYLNAIDYMRCSKFSLVWMGHRICDLRQVRGSSVGAEIALKESVCSAWIDRVIDNLALTPRLGVRNHAMLARYVLDMKNAVAEVARVLRRNGRAVYVVGDSTVRGTFVRNSLVVQQVAELCGLVLESKHSRELPPNRRYMPPPREQSGTSMDSRMRSEVVLVFDKATES